VTKTKTKKIKKSCSVRNNLQGKATTTTTTTTTRTTRTTNKKEQPTMKDLPTILFRKADLDSSAYKAFNNDIGIKHHLFKKVLKL
jgi:hypothetical protein